MKPSLSLKITFLAFLVTTLINSAAFAGKTTYRCDQGPGCRDERVNFGTAEIQCLDINGDILSDWVCEYEAEYSCRNQLTGEIRKGGFDPIPTSLCSKLCGQCKTGWK
ncbi:hypothetical protein [Maridesulfovibrio sp.]|uniref:hypothetical protein n=1 Tax=Maridesulfovibrio sp. TaxID=2795000 RepID=UPI0029F5465D|nr:hypothetical protein [Maridesulfovibrio sp.]